MENASTHGILHLAMHGAIDEKNPLNSGLIFSKRDSTDNNYLSGYDLYAMQLNTGLAVWVPATQAMANCVEVKG